MLLRTTVLALLLLRCGFTPVEECRGEPDAPRAPDARRPFDAGRPFEAGPPRDAGTPTWCAPDSAACWGDGSDVDTPGHCCLGRQTCFGLDAGTPGHCAY